MENVQPLKFANLRRKVKDEEYIEETIKALIECEGHVNRNGIRDYDKVPKGTCEDAIILLQHYKQVLDCMNEIIRKKRIKAILQNLNPI